MNYLKALLLGLIEGVTEWLPISSTAHMAIFNKFINFDVSTDFYNVFEVVIQFGAVLSLLFVFIKKIWPFGKSNNPLGKGILENVKKDKIILWLKIIVACIPAIIYELFLDDKLNIVNENNEMLVIGLSLLIVGIIFIIVEILIKGKQFSVTSIKNISFSSAFIIGVAQLLAGVFPGVSRSGATIIAGLLLGISRSVITEFTFELSIPVMFGASLMKIIKFGMIFSFNEILLLILGSISAFIVSLFMIKFILDYIKKNNFIIFGIYRILMGIIVLLFLR
jgi:undecaprenyl-diphosphatase